MVNRPRRPQPGGAAELARAEARARAAVAQARQDGAPSEPMRRYVHPIPGACGLPAGLTQGSLERILAALSYQNQLLLDLRASLNALSAALLAARSAPPADQGGNS